MKTATVKIVLDPKLREKKSGKISVKVRVTFNRNSKFYSTGIELTSDEFEKVMSNQRRTTEQKEFHTKLNEFESKATGVIKALNVFNFDSFEERYLDQRNTFNSISFAFEKYIQQLKLENRIGTAVSYECAKNSLNIFNSKLAFSDITPVLLKKYEALMLKNGKSVSTVGIYLRSLRAIYNQQEIDRSIYPFGNGKNKYSIPTSRNIKKALTIEEIAAIYHHKVPTGTFKEMAKDYWLFLYLCNGMNVKDFCLLKWSNIEDDMLYYKRAKTIRSKRESNSIAVSLKPQALDIIKRYGQPSVVDDAYIFPHLKKGMTAQREREVYQQLTKVINKYTKQIAVEIGIDKEITTYFARHSFATVLKRSGASTEMISELLDHSSVKVTDSYLSAFPEEQIKKHTDVLTAGFRKAI